MTTSTHHPQKTALITGAGGGLGRAIAEHFLSAGANVVICDINKSLLADFTSKVTSAYPERTLAVECDITSEAALDEFFAQAEKKFGQLDYVVNSAGIMDKFDPAGTLEKTLMERVLAVNLVAPAMVTKRAVGVMLKYGVPGVIVNIASIAGFKGFAAGAAYTASKHGVIGLTRNTATFYKSKGIRCNAIAAGAMETNIASAMANGVSEEGMACMQKLIGSSAPDGSFVELKKMAKLVSYLCSEDSSMINGAMITADCGVTSQ